MCIETANPNQGSSDTIYGGNDDPVELARNAPGDTSLDGRANDADFILGDNSNVFRLVDDNGYLVFAYDNYGSMKIIPRVVELLDYTLGGPDFDAAVLRQSV